MVYLITKALISGVIIMAASEAAKRSPTYGALLVSLSLISILAMIWLWRDTGDNERIAALDLLACAANTADVPRPTSYAEKWLCVLDCTCGLVCLNGGPLLDSGLAPSKARNQCLKLKGSGTEGPPKYRTRAPSLSYPPQAQFPRGAASLQFLQGDL